MRLACLGCLLVVAACGDSPAPILAVDVRTDYVAGREFARVRVEARTEAAEPMGQFAERDAEGADWLAGARAAELRGLGAGTTRIDVTLQNAAGAIVARQPVVVTLGVGTTVSTVVITRSCRDVVCPPADDPEATACIGARCADPRCTVETPEECTSEGECAVAADCTGPACVVADCVTGACLRAPDDRLCAPGAFCTRAFGCVGGPDLAPRDVLAAQIGGEEGDQFGDLDARPDGTVFLVGAIRGVARLPSGTVTAAAGSDGFVSCLARDGAACGDRVFPGPLEEYVSAVTTELGPGSVVIGANASSDTDFGNGIRSTPSLNDAVIAALSDDLATTTWAATSTGGMHPEQGTDPGSYSSRETAGACAATAAGPVCAGRFSARAEYHGVAVTNSSGGYSGFIVALGPDGATTRWLRPLPITAGDLLPGSLAVDPVSGTVFLAAAFIGDVELDDGTRYTSTDTTTDGLMVAFAPGDGSVLWAHGFGGDGPDAASAVVVADGDPIFAGSTRVMHTFDTLVVPSGSFVVRLDGATGAGVWAQPLGGIPSDATVDAAGDILLFGRYLGTDPEVLGVALPAAAPDGVWLAALGPDAGEPRWVRAIGTPGDRGSGVGAIAADASGTWIGFTFGGSLDVAGDSLVSAGSSDVVVLRVEP